MIKITDLDRLEAIKESQNQVDTYNNYLNDVLVPASKNGNWDEFEKLDIGFDTSGQTLGKIGDDEAWRKLQSFFEPNATHRRALDFTLNSKVIERNLRNEMKSVAIIMLWVSDQYYSFQSIYYTLVHLKKFVTPLLAEGLNSLSHINLERIERWVEEETVGIDFESEKTYSYINKLIVEQDKLPFNVALPKMLTADDLNLSLTEKKQYSVIPQRLYYRALCEAELLITRLFPIRDEIESLTTYLTTFSSKIYEGYSNYLHQGPKKRSSGETVWRLDDGRGRNTEKHRAFKKAFNALKTPTKREIMALIQKHEPRIHPSSYHYLYPDSVISIDGMTISNAKQATSLLTKYSGGCIWTLIAKSGMRVDEAYHLHTVNGCHENVISGQTIHVLNTNLSKTVKGLQSKQDEFVTTDLGMKAFQILESIHTPLRKLHPDSKLFFHTLKLMDGFGTAGNRALANQAKNWFNKTLASELTLASEDIKDLKISDPERNFEVGEEYDFSCHQLRRSFAYYLIGYELLSFPQLKQQFSHISLAMTRHYAKNASKFQKLRTKKGKKNLCSVIDDERVRQKAQLYLDIYNRLANKERVAGGKGKEFAKRRAERNKNNLFTDRASKGKSNNMLTLGYWQNVIRNGQRHIHVVAPGIYCTSANCSLRTQVNLIECVDCDNDYIVDAVYAEAMRKEAEEHMHYDIMHHELTPQAASESYIKITAAQRIMDNLGMDYEPVIFPKVVQNILISYTGASS
ncbi:hypothetical protein EDB14_2144 [Vibrio crassostreae]|uniref:site-specific integrase n=1 Tax=Vibrio crassostreae TaxID=246167 RepID=UPI000F4DFA70|nr:site-specific integrase [Vibrio crassostreae]RPF11045.1 hypothetical protein EDB14_2144 [Vibrio crassostreae]